MMLLILSLIVAVSGTFYIPMLTANEYVEGNYLILQALSARSAERANFPFDPADLGILCMRPVVPTGADGDLENGAFPQSNPLGKVLAGDVVRDSGHYLRVLSRVALSGRCDRPLSTEQSNLVQDAVVFSYRARFSLDDGLQVVSAMSVNNEHGLTEGVPLGARIQRRTSTGYNIVYYTGMNVTVYMNEVTKDHFNIVRAVMTPSRATDTPAAIEITSVHWLLTKTTWAQRTDAYWDAGSLQTLDGSVGHETEIAIAIVGLVAVLLVSFFVSTGVARAVLVHATYSGRVDQARYKRFLRALQSDDDEDAEPAATAETDALTASEFASTQWWDDALTDSDPDTLAPATAEPTAAPVVRPAIAMAHNRDRLLLCLDIIFCCCIEAGLLAPSDVAVRVRERRKRDRVPEHHRVRKDAQTAALIPPAVTETPEAAAAPAAEEMKEAQEGAGAGPVDMTAEEAKACVAAAHVEDRDAGQPDSRKHGEGVVTVTMSPPGSKKKRVVAIALDTDTTAAVRAAADAPPSSVPARAPRVDPVTGQRLHPIAKGRWGALRCDVWRPVPAQGALCALYGMGIQALVTLLLASVFSVGSGFLFDVRATVVGALAISWLATSSVAAFAASRLTSLFRMAAPPDRRAPAFAYAIKLALLSLIIPSLLIWFLFGFAQITWAVSNSSAAIGAPTWALLFLLVVVCGVPGVLLGTAIGHAPLCTRPGAKCAGRPYAPTRWSTSVLPRHIPPPSLRPCRWTWGRIIALLNSATATGFWLLLLNGMWREHHIFVGVSMFFAFIVWLYNSAVLGVSRVYRCLRSENWRWHWAVYWGTFADTALVMAVTAAAYYLFLAPKTMIADPAATVLFAIVTGGVIFYVSAMHASLALFAASSFVLHIYRGTSKSD